MMVHDLIKIKLSREGYLPDYPPHLISDEEMCRAFIGSATSRSTVDWFHDNFAAPEGFESQFAELERGLYDATQSFIQSTDPDKELPNWVYAYMMGAVIGPNSDVEDRHNALVLMGLDNKDDELTDAVYQACYRVSTLWLPRYSENRPNTIFIEPFVIKYYRLRASV